MNEAMVRVFLQEDYRRLVAGLTVICGSHPLAEEAVQEALARAWEQGERGQRIQSLKAWVSVVARNYARSGIRKRLAEHRAHARLSEGMSSTSHRPPPPEERMDAVRAVQALPTRQREVIALYYFADLTVGEIASALKAHPETVKSLLHRGRIAVSRSLGAQYVDEGERA